MGDVGQSCFDLQFVGYLLDFSAPELLPPDLVLVMTTLHKPW